MKLTVARKGGVFVIESGMKTERCYEIPAALEALLPRIPKEGETVTFEIKEVD